jgi:hypothetical protein
VQLLTLQYRDPTGASATAAHFTGDMTLLASLTSVTGTSCIRAQVHLGECLSAAGQSRKTLAQQAHAKMNAHFLTPAQDAR